MKYTFTFLLFFLIKSTMAFDIIDDVAVAFKNGNAKEIGRYFASTVELSVLDQDNIYSANQAELILKDFLSKHHPTAVKVIHKVVSKSNFKFGVIIFTSNKNNYRISYELKGSSNSFTISQIRIEENKE